MAKKKRRVRKKKKQGKSRVWWIGFFAVCFFCIFTLVSTFYFIFLHQPSMGPDAVVTAPEEKSVGELAEKPRLISPSKQKNRPQVPIATDHRPLVAIVIDDMGRNEIVGQRLLDLDLNLSFAFLPKTPHAKTFAQIAGARGRDVLLHLPMEPLDGRFDPGPGALFTSMSGREIISAMHDNLGGLSNIVGINNHMGSRFTANKTSMVKVLEVVRENNLFFLDSVTSADSVAYTMAVTMGVKTGRRDVFLDNEKDQAKIMAQIDHLIDLAKKNGEAIAIGHPYQETYKTLAAVREELLTQVQVVGVKQLMR